MIECIIKFGDNECFHGIKREIFRIRLLSEYSFKENLEDKGSGIREKAKYLINLLSDENFFHEEKKKAADIWHKFSLNSAKEDLAGNSEKNESYTGHVRKSVGNDEIFVPKISQKKTENAEIEQKTNFSLPTQNEDKKVSNFDIFMVPDIKPAKTEKKQQETDEKQEKTEKKFLINTVVKPLKPPPSFVPISTVNLFEKKDDFITENIKSSNSLDFVASENLISSIENDLDKEKFVDTNKAANFDLLSENHLNEPWNPLGSDIFEARLAKESQYDVLSEN